MVRIRSFSDHHAEYLNQFLEMADKYRGAPFLIVDIRGNGGGNEVWPKRWIARFTGQQPSSKRYFAELISKTTMMGRANTFERLLDFYPETDEYKLERDQYLAQVEAFERHAAVPHWTGPFSAPVQAIPNETTVIVVMNGKVGSAGEGFINYISQVENVLFVGENSWGALVFGQVSYHRLAHSTLLVQMPISLNIPLDLELREERGFFPHLWVPGEDALNYAVAAARRGTITALTTLPEGYFDGAFVPEKSLRSNWIYVHREQLLLSVGLIVFGLVGALILRKQTSFFIVFGTSVIVQAVVLIIKDRSFGYLLVLYGMLFLAVGIFKWRRNKIALETNPTG